MLPMLSLLSAADVKGQAAVGDTKGGLVCGQSCHMVSACQRESELCLFIQYTVCLASSYCHTGVSKGTKTDAAQCTF